MTNTIHISLSEAWKGKESLKTPPDHTTFKPATVTVEQFTALIRQGKRWAGCTFKNQNRAEKNANAGWTLALDLDDHAPEDVKSDVATIIYPTAQNGVNGKKRCRMVFVLAEPITDISKWRKAQAACLYHYRSLNPDQKRKDPAVGWYGAGQGKWQIYPERRLTRKYLDAWIENYDKHIAAELEKTKNDAPAAPPLTGQPLEKYAQKALEGVIADLRTKSEGDRNVWLFRATCRVLGFVKGGWPGMTETRVLAEIRSTARAIGLPESEIDRTIRSATERATAATLPQDTSTPPVSLAEYDAPPMPPPPVLNIQVVTGEEASQRAAKIFEERLMNPQAIIGMKSDITALDYALGGFAPGGCYTFLAPTGAGKTTLCASLAYKFAGQGRGIIASAENSAEAFIDKMVAYATQQSYGDIRRGCKLVWEEVGAMGDTKVTVVKFTAAEVKLIDAARDRISEYIKGTVFVPGGSPSPAMLRSVFADYGKDAQWAILDSLNNIRVSGLGEYENVTEAALLAEELAVDYNLSMIATAQGGRNTKDRKNKQLTINDAVGSNHVENKGHALISIYNQWKLLDDEMIGQKDIDPAYPRGQVKFRILKLRDGNPGKPLAVKYVGGSGFYSPDKQPPPSNRGIT